MSHLLTQDQKKHASGATAERKHSWIHKTWNLVSKYFCVSPSSLESSGKASTISSFNSARVIGKVGMTGAVKAMASIGNSLHLSLKMFLGIHVCCKNPTQGQQIPPNTFVQWRTAQELNSLATFNPTSLEYDESKVCEDFFGLGKNVLEIGPFQTWSNATSR